MLFSTYSEIRKTDKVHNPGDSECLYNVRLEVFMALFLRSVRRLLVTASVVPSSAILVTLMKEAISSGSCKSHTV
jgi:hypothetical protein